MWNYNWEQLFPATLTSLPHGANVRVCVRIYVSLEGESSRFIRQPSAPWELLGSTRLDAALSEKRGVRWVTPLFGEVKVVWRWLLSQTYGSTRGRKEGHPHKTTLLPYKGHSWADAAQIKPPPHHPIPQWNLPGNILEYTGSILPLFHQFFLIQTLYSWPPGYYRPFCVLIGLTGGKEENKTATL